MTSYGFLCMTKYCFSSAMVFIVDEGYMTKFETGVIAAAFWAMYAIAQLFGGALADRLKPENLITIALFGSGIINLAIYFCYESYVLTIVLWSLNALVQIGGWPASFKIISTMAHESQREKANVIISMMSPVGVLGSYFVAAMAVKWQHNFIVSALGSFILMIAWLIATRTTSKYVVTETSDPMNITEMRNDGAQKGILIRLLLSSGLIFLLLISFLRTFLTQIQTLVPTMINESYDGVAPSFATVLSLVVLFCNALGPVFGNKLSRFMKNEMLAAAVLFFAMIPMGLVTLFVGKINYWFIIAATAGIVLCASATSYFTMTLASIAYIKWGVGATVAGIINGAAAFGIVGANFVLTLIAERCGWVMTLITIEALTVLCAMLAFIGTPIWRRFRNI